jgi:hypothetical protein
VLVLGNAVFHGQHQQTIGTALVAAPGRRSAGGSVAVPNIVALTSRKIVFRLAKGSCDALVDELASAPTLASGGSGASRGGAS